MKTLFHVLMIFGLIQAAEAAGRTYHVDSQHGNDQNTGLSAEQAWKSLENTAGLSLRGGDKILLKRGCVFKGQLALENASGSSEAPVVVNTYGEGAAPIIDGVEVSSAVLISASSFLEVNNLEVTADASKSGREQGKIGIQISGGANPASHIVLRNVYIHDIFKSSRGGGIGISIAGSGGSGGGGGPGGKKRPGRGGSEISDVLVEKCRIERTAQFGIRVSGVNNLSFIDNELKDIGGPGIQPSGCRNLVIRGNTVDGSGSAKLDLMFGRGSGAWIHSCSDVLVEKNVFMNAEGINDSCGFHTDAWNNNVLVQYNLSIHNAGGFVEILGDNRNTVYRYNVSINDGWRVEGEENKRGKYQNSGSILWLSGFIPGNAPRKGPFNSYIYNNTVFVAKEQASSYSFAGTTEGVLIANNIFYFLGPVETAKPKQMDLRADPTGQIDNAVFQNNLYRTVAGVPDDLKIKDTDMIIGEPYFANPGGLDPMDYIPGNAALIKDKGIKIEKLPGDEIGIKEGLEVKVDFFGNPIVGLPDMGAIEIR